MINLFNINYKERHIKIRMGSIKKLYYVLRIKLLSLIYRIIKKEVIKVEPTKNANFFNSEFYPCKW